MILVTSQKTNQPAHLEVDAAKTNQMLAKKISEIQQISISSERQKELQPVISYIQKSLVKHQQVNLNFICTHNSRRSQFSQVWATVAANHFEIPSKSFSGGVEVTACNERTIASLKRFGFQVELKVNTQGDKNPIYTLTYPNNKDFAPVECFSKLFDDKVNPAENFAAIMTCSHADENCPYIPGAEERIPMRFNDPKAYDDTDLEAVKYDERSVEIASELFYVFGQVDQKRK